MQAVRTVNLKKINIRFNTSNTSDLYWRLVIDGKEYLVNDIKINVPTFTSMDIIETGESKWHISCWANAITWNDNKVQID